MKCDAKPVGVLSAKELIALEHKYRLLLKKSGFQDVEMWDNKPNQKVKKIKFIKGHIRFKPEVNPKSKEKWFFFKSLEIGRYFHVIGLYAHHCTCIPDKYREILKDYSLTGNLALSIRNTKSNQHHESVLYYIKTNLSKMIDFVNKEFKDE